MIEGRKEVSLRVNTEGGGYVYFSNTLLPLSYSARRVIRRI